MSVTFRQAKYVALLHAGTGAAYVNSQVTLENSINYDKIGPGHFRYEKRRNFKTSNVRGMNMYSLEDLSQNINRLAILDAIRHGATDITA